MFIKFGFENYRSFLGRQELSLVANSSRQLSESLIKTDAAPHGLVRTAVIYGANASGKSNVLRALQFFINAIRNSQRAWDPSEQINLQPFALASTTPQTSRFDLDFTVEDKPFQYGFSATADAITAEWLYHYPHGRKQVWFERTGEDPISFGAHLLGENRAIEKLTRKNSLYLSAAAQNNHDMLSPVFKYLTSSIRIVFGSPSPDAVLAGQLRSFRNPLVRDRLTSLLKHADLGIVGLSVKTTPFDEQSIQTMSKINTLLSELMAPKQPPEPPKEHDDLNLLHRRADGSTVPFGMGNESAGTVAYLGLLPRFLTAIERGGVLCVDELDASLHPLLTLELVRFFNDPSLNKTNAQLIFNTHNVVLLDENEFRRDQIWFTEKDSSGESHLYPLTDFKPRSHESLKRGYLQGRFGAIPFLGHFSVNESEESDGSK